MKVKLTVFDRLILLNILPDFHDITTIGILNKFREDLSFTEEEHSNLLFGKKNSEIKWKSDADCEKEFIIGDKIDNIIVGCLSSCQKEGLLQDQHMSLYCKFMSKTNGDK